MKKLKIALTGGAMLLGLAACADQAELAIRERSTGLAAGSQSAAFRVGEARAHFRLGNVALAAEGFRRALREDPKSIDALNGLAACYDRLGRFDLSRSYYERALALAPDDARLYANLATSLSLQGKVEEAARVRTELAERLGAAQSISLALASPQGPPASPVAAPVAQTSAPAASVSLALTDAAASTVQAAPIVPPVTVESGPRLERVGLAEVMLLTEPSALRAFAEATPARAPSTAAQVKMARQPVPVRRLAITVLNGARVDRLAATTRVRLQRLGWRDVAIGDAPRVLARSELAFPERRRAEAERLARQLGIAAKASGRTGGSRLVITLGRDQVKRQQGA